MIAEAEAAIELPLADSAAEGQDEQALPGSEAVPARVAAAQVAAHRHLALQVRRAKPALSAEPCAGSWHTPQVHGKRLGVQASSMAALVSHVEELVEQAEMSCSLMQASHCCCSCWCWCLGPLQCRAADCSAAHAG